ncbi:MAG: S8 family serine peptidase [Arenicella sp.]
MTKMTIIASCISLMMASTATIVSADITAGKTKHIMPEYEFILGSQKLTPSAGIADNLAQQIEDAAKKRAGMSGQVDGKAHIVVQAFERFTPQLNKSLAEIGVLIQSRVNPYTWIAKADAEAVDKLQQITDIRWAGLLEAAGKISPEINEDNPFEWQKRASGFLAYSVLFHSDVSFEEVLNLQKSLGFELEEADKASFAALHRVQLAIQPGRLQELAAADIVVWLEASSAPDEDKNVATAQPLSNVDDVQAAPYNLTGTGVTVGIWEAGDVIDTTALDIAGRVTVEAGQTAGSDDHALHVTGTIGGTGNNVPLAQGMATAVTMSSWDSASDTAEMLNAVTSTGGVGQPVPIQISNHSYGATIGWSGNNFNANQALFGQYTTTSQGFDNAVINGLLVVKAAGNDRNDGLATATVAQPADCFQAGGAIAADCIGPRGSAKNVVTVGAMNGAGAITTFSGFGPTDDGRIKPDVMAEGQFMLSLACNCFDDRDGDGIDDIPDSTTAFRNMGGTSMSTPVVTGVSALLMEQANSLNINLSPAAVKAILIQTANDVAGPGQSNVGPDYATGWGIADAQAAADLLRNPTGAGVAQETVSNTGVANAYNHPFYVPSGQPEMHVTLAWTDPAGNPATPSAAQLVNDLDLRLIAPDGVTTFTPWTLNPAFPGNAAVRNGGDDSINNVEQVSVLTPVSGVWTIQVSAKAGSLVAGPQDFAIAGPLNPSAGPIASDKADVVMVLDKSGSMSLSSATPGLSKMDALQGAANEFLDYMELVGGHQVGLVQFDSAVRAFTPTFDLQALNSASIADAHSAIGSMSAGGMTNIISGVTEAQSQLSGPAAANPNKTIFLFSDGKHNRPLGSDVADIDGIMAADTDFYAIGFGTDVDSTVMPTVAANHNGLYLEEQSLTAAQLSKMFLTIAGLTVDEDIVIDPDYHMAPYGTVEQKAYISKAASSVTFATHWNSDNAEQIQLQLQGPGKDCRILTKDHPGYATRAGNRYRLIRVELPYQCRKTGEILHDGVWTLKAYNKSAKAETAKIMVLSDSSIDMQTKVKVIGNKVLMTAAFADSKDLLRRDINIYAALSKTVASTKDSLKQDEQGSKNFRFPYKNRYLTNTQLQTSLPKIDIFNLQPAAILSLPEVKRVHGKEVNEPTMIHFYDDGRNGDVKKGDGIFSAVTELPKGLYQLRVAGQLKTEKGVVARENWKSFSIVQ